MAEQLRQAQIDRWRALWDEQFANKEWTAQKNKRDARRLVVQKEMTEFLSSYLCGKIQTEEFRATFDNKTRTHWDVFGLKGMSGAMFLNKLVKHIPDQKGLTSQLQSVLPLPESAERGRQKMTAFMAFLQDSMRSGGVTKAQIQPARLPFFTSAWWHVQDTEQWPVYYESARWAFEKEGLFEPTYDPIGDYFAFREAYLSLASAISLKSWQLEQACLWMKEKDAPPSTPPTAVTPPPTEPADVPGHTEAQGLLADIGKKLGCSIWIAQNDRNKLYQGRPLGNLSLPALPALGMESEAEKTVSRIDVLWLRGKNQIVAAFEIEQTTSIYSGLLRMSDLVSSAPNTHFPLYIVAPRKRQGEVRGELARPTFKYLELYKRCGFIPNEELAAKGQHIISWANDPSAINKLAARFDDIEAEE